MNILMVHNYYQIPGGEDTVVQNEKALLEANGCQVFLYTRKNEEIKHFSVLQKLMLPFQSIFSWKTYREVRKEIREKQIDAVHVHNTLSLISPAVYYAARKENVPALQTVHNFRLICPAATLQRDGHVCEDCVHRNLFCAVKHSCYRGSKIQTIVSALVLWVHRKIGIYRKVAYICLTDFNRKQLLLANEKGKNLFDAKRMYVKPNFTEVAQVGGLLSERSRQYLYVGRMDKLKGICILLERWKNIPEKLVICGTGPEEAWCREFCKSNQMEQVVFLGQTKREQVLELLRDSRALIFPTQWYEGQPMTVIESLACGTPVIGTRIGNVQEMIEDGLTGKLLDLRLDGLAEALEGIEDAMCSACRREYEQKYIPQANYRVFEQIWEKECKV